MGDAGGLEVSGERVKLLVCHRIPNIGHRVVSSGDEPPAVGRPGTGVDRACMRDERGNKVAGDDVADRDARVLVGECEAEAVGGEGKGANPAVVCDEFVEDVLGRHVPYDDRSITRRCSQQTRVGADGESDYLQIVTAQRSTYNSE